METNKPTNFENALAAMKATEPTAEDIQRATNRVLDRLQGEQAANLPDRLQSCDDFRSAFAPYARKELAEAKQMLVDDHLKTCPRCRRAYDEFQGKVLAFVPPPQRKSPVRPFIPWAVAAGVLFAVGYMSMDTVDRLMAPAGPRAQVSSVSGEIYKVSAAGISPLKSGEPIGEKEVVRTAKGSSAVVRLPDGSLIEMNERSELSITGAYSGNTIKLDRGNILVQAAKQKLGSLKVATRESTVSVKGTIFTVATGLRGTQVAVVEGNVLVDQNGKTEDLLPGQATGSDAALKRTTVRQQVAWSKDSARYYTILGEMAELKQKLSTLPMPALRTDARLLRQLPANTVVYAAIPNLSGQMADASKIFEDKVSQSSALKEWWSSKNVAQMREVAEKLRTVGSQLGDEIVFTATTDGNSIGDPMILAEVRGSSARTQLEGQMKQVLGDSFAQAPFVLNDKYLLIAPNSKSVVGLKANLESGVQGGFEGTKLAKTVQQSYAKGAGWVLAVDLEQIFAASVNQKDKASMSFTGINSMENLLVERRDTFDRHDTRATVSFKEARKGMASWLAKPAPMSSLEYISPDATFAMSAVTKSARQMAEEVATMFGSQGPGAEQLLGMPIFEELLGPIGGEMTIAVDGALLPVPTWVVALEVYNPTGLSATLKKLADLAAAMDKRIQVQFTEERVQGVTWYRIKSPLAPVELNFTFDQGYMIAAASRETIQKAMQNRQTGRSLPRSQTFRGLLPADTDLNASAILFFNTGSGLKDLATQATGAFNLSDEQKQAIQKMLASSEPVLICAYADDQRLTVASTSGFFGFGLENLLMAGKGMPVLPVILGSAMRAAAPLQKTSPKTVIQ